MSSSFSPISLAINVGAESYQAHPDVLLGPATYEPRRSRVVMHETLHWWQHLGHGFLSFVAGEDWQRLQEFEATKKVPPTGPWRKEFVRKHPKLGFSALNLHEALTRFWDMHICGPVHLLRLEREEAKWTNDSVFERFDVLEQLGLIYTPDGGYTDKVYALAMEGAGGRYAAAYRLAFDPSESALAGILFPLAAHFAFQTSRPTDFFARFVHELRALVHTPLGFPSIEELWLDLYPRARMRTFGILKAEKEQLLFPITEIFEGPLKSHPGYAMALNVLEYLAAHAAEGKLGKRLRQELPRTSDDFLGVLVLDVLLATPGVPDHRSVLYQHLAPPLVCFSDGARWLLGIVREDAVDPPKEDRAYRIERFEKAAAVSEDLSTRWQAMVDARYAPITSSQPFC